MVSQSGDPDFREPRSERGTGSLEQRLDRWVNAGRQLVDGVAGARPGSRTPARPGGLSRWLEERVDWLLEDGDDWREPWQEAPPPPPPRRRSLEAISRRAARPAAPRPAPAAGEEPPLPASAEDWPDDTTFTVPRWQRPEPSSPPGDDRAAPPPAPAPAGRPLPRSTRRRP